MSHLDYIVCSVCQNGILDPIAQIGIEGTGDPESFQSLSLAGEKIYHCDKCNREFVKDQNNRFLELK